MRMSPTTSSAHVISMSGEWRLDTGITALTILENASFGYFYALSYSCADDDSPAESNVPPKVDISYDSQVLQVPHVRGLSKPAM
jgi:hypothetical protein